MNNPISADECWLRMAAVVSERSKDPNTRVGCVLVSPDGREIAVGWNGFPAGMHEDAVLWQRPQKYDYVIHAETNAILNAKTDLTGWSLYSTLLPCRSCCLFIIQSRISRVIYHSQESLSVDTKTSVELLRDNGVLVFQLDLED